MSTISASSACGPSSPAVITANPSVEIIAPMAAATSAGSPAKVACPEPPVLGPTEGDRLRHLTERYRHEPIPSAILEATVELHRLTPMHRLHPVPVHRGDRIVLLGDAAHPVGAGQGASVARRTRWCWRGLATEQTVATAVSAYGAVRSTRIAKMAAAAADNRDAKTAGPLARRIHDLMMPVGIRLFYERATAWLYTHDCGELPPRRTSTPIGTPL